MLPRRYWDSCVFIAFSSGETGRSEQCWKLLEEAKRGQHLVVTSAITIAEVTRKGGERIKQPPSMAEVERFFENSYFLFVQTDVWVARAARALVWELGITANDALHISAAHRARCPVFYTYDKPLLELNGKVPELSILEPRAIAQDQLPLVLGHEPD
jgi:predicted nucleic acid-binding protein